MTAYLSNKHSGKNFKRGKHLSKVLAVVHGGNCRAYYLSDSSAQVPVTNATVRVDCIKYQPLKSVL